jgi:putative ABC transport system permease protein
MILKNISLAIRHIMRYRAYSILNIIGLAIGMASAMLIILWVNNEISIDKFHKNGKDLCLVRSRITFSDGQTVIWPTSGPIGPDSKAEIPEIKSFCRLVGYNTLLFRLGEKSFFERGYFADSTFFTMFSFNLISGNPQEVLINPNSVVISEKLAKKYFGNENPIGKSITIRYEKEEVYIISGVLKDVTMSSITFDFILPFSKLYEFNKNALVYDNYWIQTYILSKPNTDNKQLSNKITKVLHKNDSWAKEHVITFVQPFADSYLFDSFDANIKKPSGKIIFIRIFSIVAIFILFLACMNYTNLATALAIKRSKEVGIKKAYGSKKTELIVQFTLEAIVLTFIGFFLSIIIVECALPSFNVLIGKEIEFNYNNLKVLGWFLIVPFTTGILAGIFPAVYISSFKPITVLKNIFTTRKGSIHFRHILVIFQFVITITFIISSFVIHKQINYIQTKTLGLDKDNIIFFEQSAEIKKHRQRFKDELKKQTGIIDVTYTGTNPLAISNSTGSPSWRGQPVGVQYLFPFIQVDSEFSQTMGAEIVLGRDFSADFPADTNCILINQAAMKIMGFENPIGEIVDYWGRRARIIGVVKDFHFSNLHVPIRQMMIIYRPSDTYLTLVKINGHQRKLALKNIEKVFRDFESNVPFEYKFLDEEYAEGYDTEKYMSRLSNLFAVLAIIISCLGLFGLALFTAEQKTKEIGIRKSIGAKTYEVVILLARDFLKWIAIAYVIACIVAYFVLNAWLQDFAYRTEISWWIFVVTGLITAAIALITVSWQSYRAASRNPVECLRYE